jgi:hypothetical protein
VTDSPRTYEQALEFARHEHERESQDWDGMCQKFVRTCYSIPALFASAWAQWNGADPEDRHPGGKPADAPLGSALCFKGTSPFGHIMLAARDNGAWSNDVKRQGDIDWCTRSFPATHWHQNYLGYLTAVNDYDLQLREAKPPRPKQTKRYEAVARAINNIDTAIENAKKRDDWKDVKVLRAQRNELRDLYELVRHI